MTLLEVFDPWHDDGRGTGHRIVLTDGVLVGADAAAEDILAGQRRRHPELSDSELAKAMSGWSNGWCSIRPLPAP